MMFFLCILSKAELVSSFLTDSVIIYFFPPYKLTGIKHTGDSSDNNIVVKKWIVWILLAED